MEINKFLNLIGKVRTSAITTGGLSMRVICNADRTRVRITRNTMPSVCPRCGHPEPDITKWCVVLFKSPQKNLTLFQAEMLYTIFVLDKKPYDYQDYHECPAGKEFIENIEKIEVS